jgi:putative membrane protein insertion efficiency factor
VKEQRERAGVVARMALLLITGYRRWISPLIGANCRYQPTCSAYAQQAVERFGARRGLWLAVRRIGRCHPFHDGGYDPVPEATLGTRALQGNAP